MSSCTLDFKASVRSEELEVASPHEDHDQRLKEAVKSKFSDAIDLLLPEWLPLFDFSKLEWIEQEIFPDPPKGTRRSIDMPAKLPTLQPITAESEEPPIRACVGLVHLELEAWDSIAFMRRRMRDYRHYLSRKFQLPVLPLCIYVNAGMEELGWADTRFYRPSVHSIDSLQ